MSNCFEYSIGCVFSYTTSRKNSMNEKEQLKVLNKATDKALTEINTKRKTKNVDFILEFHQWYKLVSKYLKQMLNS